MTDKQFMHRAKTPPHFPVGVMKKQKSEEEKRPFSTTPALIQRAVQAPLSITPMEAAQLQRTFGNQALGRMLRVQAKLTVGPVGDKYEQEADAVAKQVVQRINAPQPQAVQRQEEEDELQMKPSSMQRQEEDEEALQMKPFSTMEGGAISPDIESDIQRARGGGRPLSPNTQSSMSQAFNADFSGVRIHTGSHSNHLNQSIQARAFTTGQDIFFRDGAYNPNNSAGQKLLAHELTHTIQQSGRQVQRSPLAQIKSTNAVVVQRWRPFKKKKKTSPKTRKTQAKGGGNFTDYLLSPFNKGRRQERILARKTFQNEDVRGALKSSLRLLQKKFDDSQSALKEESVGKKYSPTKKGRYTKTPLKQKLDELSNKLGSGNPTDNAFYQDIAAVFADAAKVFKSHIESKIRKTKEEGYFFNIKGKAGKMRKVLNKGPLLTTYRKANSIYKKMDQFNESRGPSSTTLSTLNLAKYVGCNNEEMRAIAWGLFAWWRTKTRSFHRYHTFKEVMLILNSYLGEEFFQSVPDEPLIEERPASESEGYLE